MLDQREIAEFKLDIWKVLMNYRSHTTTPSDLAHQAELIYEQFYLGKTAE